MSSPDQINVRDIRQPGWFWLGNEVIDDYAHRPCKDGKTLGAHGVFLYAVLCRHAFHNSCQISLQKLQDLSGLSRHTVINYLDRLEELGLLKKDAGNYTKENTYYLLNTKAGSAANALPQKMEAEVVQELHQGSAQAAPGVVQMGSAADAPLFTKTKIKTKQDLEQDSFTLSGTARETRAEARDAERVGEGVINSRDEAPKEPELTLSPVRDDETPAEALGYAGKPVVIYPEALLQSDARGKSHDRLALGDFLFPYTARGYYWLLHRWHYKLPIIERHLPFLEAELSKLSSIGKEHGQKLDDILDTYLNADTDTAAAVRDRLARPGVKGGLEQWVREIQSIYRDYGDAPSAADRERVRLALAG
jgi:DNA-binding MarR family transcriptional regulator